MKKKKLSFDLLFRIKQISINLIGIFTPINDVSDMYAN